MSINDNLVLAANSTLQEVQELIEAGADLNHADNFGDTALMAASRGGKLDIVELLLSCGADVNRTFPNKTGWTALMHGANYGFPQIVTVLIQQGANTEIKNNKGQTVWDITPCMNMTQEEMKDVIEMALQGNNAQIMPSMKNQYDEKDDDEFDPRAMTESLENFLALYRKTCVDFDQEPHPLIEQSIGGMIDQILPVHVLNLCGKGFESRLTDNQVFPLFEVLGHGFPNSPFKTIDLSFNNIRNSGAKAIAVFLTQTRSLTCLNLAGNSIGQIGCQKIAQALYGQETLRTLNFNTNPIGDEGIIKIAETLMGNTTLTEVDIGNTDMGVLSIIRIANMLSANSTLTTLNLENPLHHNAMEDTTIHLSKALAQQSTLQNLSLAKHKIQDHGANWLSEYLEKNIGLTYLDLSCNKLSATGVANLVRGLATRSVGLTVKLDNNLLRGTEHDEILEAIDEANEKSELFLSWSSDQACQELVATLKEDC